MPFENTNTDILLAGAFAAFSIDLLVYPLDTIKTRIQAPEFRQRYTNVATGAVNRSLFRGLYQGIGSVILATVPSSGAFFTAYEGTKSLLASTSLPLPLAHALASATGECVSCVILTPAEVLKQNAQMVSSRLPPKEANKIFDQNATLIALRKFSSPTQLWRGYLALTGRNLPFTAMQFPVFESLRSRIHLQRERNGKATGSLWERGTITALAAGSSGSLAAVITTPIDVVKTRIMLAASSTGGKEAARTLQSQGKNVEEERARMKKLSARSERPGGLAIGREIFRTEGVRGLFRGGALRGLWTALGSGLYLGVYESGRKYLERRRQDESDAA